MEERQRLKAFEDRIIDILMVLDSTNDTITSLHEKYNQFRYDANDDSEDLRDYKFDSIDFALQEKRRDVESSRRKIENLRTKVKSTTELVRTRLFLASPKMNLLMACSFQVFWTLATDIL